MARYEIEYGRVAKEIIEAETLSDAVHRAAELAHSAPPEETVVVYSAKEAWAPSSPQMHRRNRCLKS